MSTQKSKDLIVSEQIVAFYTKNLKNFGSSSQGVGWKNDHAQTIRFHQLTKILGQNDGPSINDLGCGSGKYFDFLLANGYSPNEYNGYDILEEMIVVAKQSLPIDKRIKLTKIISASEMRKADYTIASGIFNVKYDAPVSDWLQNILLTLETMDSKSSRGFAFNLLSKYSDKEFMRDYLYYADPLFLFDYCKQKFSKNVALLHDYDQYDFTILVRKESVE